MEEDHGQGRLVVIAALDQRLASWQHRCVTELADRIVGWLAVPPSSPLSSWASLLNRWASSAWDRPAETLPDIPRVVLELGQPEVGEELRALKLDAILDLTGQYCHLADGLGIPIWSFELGEDGSIPGVRESAAGAPVIKAHLIATTPGGERLCLKRGVFPLARDGVRRSRARLLADVGGWPSAVFARANPLHTSPRAEIPRPQERVSVRDVIRFSWIELGIWVRRIGRHLTISHWNVGIVDEPITSLLDPEHRPHVRWYKSLKPMILADPFGLYSEGHLYVVAEEKDLGRGAAWISVLEGWGPEEKPKSTPVLRASHHLSYPSLLEFEGERYMIPEAARSGRVELYRAVTFPWSWEKVGVLLEESVLDPTIFRFEDRWWMLGAKNGFELHGWYASDLHGPWVQHKANPLKIDVRSGRPAGRPFIHAGELYRPAQDLSRTYGGGIALNRIKSLTDDGLEETTVRILEPDPSWPFEAGTHHVCDLDGSYLIDAKRLSIRPSLIARRISRRLLGTAHVADHEEQ